METIYEKSVAGRRAVLFSESEGCEPTGIDTSLLREKPAALPEVPEHEVVRHYTRLSRMNYSIDTHFYPLGSCTMKYNPRACEAAAALEGFTGVHPLWPQLRHGGLLTQGVLEILYNLNGILCEITGLAEFTLQPLAGSHGELTGGMIIAAYHRHKGNKKTHIIVPDSSHGTNPASASLAGYEVVTVPSDEHGVMDMEAFRAAVNEETAGLMITAPNTLGLFNPALKELSEVIHDVDGLMYYDGANLNAIMGRVRPGDLGFDLCHLNLHKSFSTPHGGGGPGSGPVGVCEKLKPFLPVSRVERTRDGTFSLNYDEPLSIGYIAPFYGNFSILVRAYMYLIMLGREGVLDVSGQSVLNANYLLEQLRPHLDAVSPGHCMHECVFNGHSLRDYGVQTLDLAKALIDRGVHPPTIYFPLNVPDAIMIEPTETETCETLDVFATEVITLLEQAKIDPDSLHRAPVTTPVGRLDEVAAARNMELTDTHGN